MWFSIAWQNYLCLWISKRQCFKNGIMVSRVREAEGRQAFACSEGFLARKCKSWIQKLCWFFFSLSQASLACRWLGCLKGTTGFRVKYECDKSSVEVFVIWKLGAAFTTCPVSSAGPVLRFDSFVPKWVTFQSLKDLLTNFPLAVFWSDGVDRCVRELLWQLESGLSP